MTGGCATIVLQNDAAARSVADQLAALPVPPGAERVAVGAKAGKLVGNGNGMQYLGAMLIRSDAQPEQIVAFYEAREAVGSGITVNQRADLGAYDDSVAADLVGASDRPDEYVVSVWGSSPSWVHEEMDLRGH